MQFYFFLIVVVSLIIRGGVCKRIEIFEDDGQALKEAFTWSRISYVISESDCLKIPLAKEVCRNKSVTGKNRPLALNNKPRILISEDNESLNFTYKSNVPMGANRWRNKLFISVPRRRDGVLSTLNYVPMHSIGQSNIPLIPYPDFETNRFVEPAEANVNRFISVYRVAVDVCDRLWFVDIGRVQTIGNNRRVQPQSLYVIDLTTDKIIRKYPFKDTDFSDMNGFYSITVDTTVRTCSEAYAYMPDSLGNGIVVYSFKSDASWRFEHESFPSEPNQNGFLVGETPVLFKDGVFSISLSEIKADGFRDAYYHPLIGISLYKVSTKVLKDKNLAGKVTNEKYFKLVGKRLANSQSTGSGLHQPTGLMFFGLAAQNAVACWNTKNPFKDTDFDLLYKDDVKMLYPSDLKIYKDDIIVISNRFPIFVYSELNYEEVNFRVFMNSIYEAARGTKCAGYRIKL